MKVSIIVAVSQNRVIGNKNKIPWYIPADLKHFKKITMGHHILMGRKTYHTIGRVLPGRTGLILTRDRNFKAEGYCLFQTLNDAIAFAKKRKEKELMIIGGGEIYRLALPLVQKIYMTKVFKKYQGEITFPKIDKNKWKITAKELHLESDPPFEFEILEKKG